tara:strand:+ start:526 stop:666 length:141 start_codon:yes stop_codon:yes gene_type:complete
MTSFDTIQKQLAEHLAELPIRNLADAGVDLKLVYKFLQDTSEQETN